MTLSIVITTFNSERFIERALQSVLSQTRYADEIIICDDNSTDRTIEICNYYKEKVKIIVTPNGPSGLCNAFNFAMIQSASEYFSILHFDDLLDSNYLFHVENALTKNPDCKFLYVGCDYLDASEKLIIPYHSTPSLIPVVYSGAEYAISYLFGVRNNKHIHRCPGVVFHKEIADKGLRFRKEAGIILDDDLFYRVGHYTNVIGINYPLAHVRHHEESETGALNFFRLHLELAIDYEFLINDWTNNSLTGEKGIISYYYFAYLNLFRGLYYGVLGNEFNEVSRIQNIYKNIKQKYPAIYRKNRKITYEMAFILAKLKFFPVLRICFLCYRILEKIKSQYR